MKSFVFVIRRSPHAGVAARETLDMLMTVAAFDQTVRVLFLDDGVFQLKAGQRPQVLDFRPIAPMFEALEIYGIEELWVESESLSERGLEPQGLILPVHQIDRREVGRFIAAADIVVGG
ncbi:MAG: sulfurtransferase complex subunit TusC [Methylococcaceae bacterium]|nr:sulfurtransferase complex subunit TusC [Methylococcaceae bacterium]